MMITSRTTDINMVEEKNTIDLLVGAEVGVGKVSCAWASVLLDRRNGERGRLVKRTVPTL